jgi:integrase
MTDVTVTTILDTRRKKTNETYPVKIRLTHKRKQDYLSTGIDLFKDEWAEITKQKVKKDYKATKDELTKKESKVLQIVAEMKYYSFTQIEKLYKENAESDNSLLGLYKDQITRLYEEERIGTAKSYQCSLNSIRDYKLSWKLKEKFLTLESKIKIELRERVKIDFEDISPDFLRKYEIWMLKQGYSISTVGIYLRALRAIINNAISDKNILPEVYPFGKRKYTIPSSKNTKKALTINDVRSIRNYLLPENSTIQKARDIWVFSYLCNGMNIKDIANLKYRNIDGDYIKFVREKTKRSKKNNQKEIRIYLLTEIREILERWGNLDTDSNNYIFPILNLELSAKKQYDTIQQTIKLVNKYIRVIAKDLKIEKDITTYTARHTYSTVLKRSGVNVEFISEALGHSDIKTTESYLDSFENEALKEHASKLI